MPSKAIAPVHLGRLKSLRVLIGFATDPIATTARLHAKYGPFVVLQYPHSRGSRPQILPCISDAKLFRSVVANSEAWRTVNVQMRAFKKHPANRLNLGMTRLQGIRHTHYRRLLMTLLSQPSVAAMGPAMATMAHNAVESWPRDRAIDFIPLTASLMQELATDLLFGEDRARALPVARMIEDAVAAAWPLPGPAYFRWLRTAPKLERAINEWAEQKRGNLNPKDFFSVLVNTRDEWDLVPSQELIAGILVFTFGAAYETCQNALLWTLVLLTQHPHIGDRLTREIEIAADDASPAQNKLSTLPLLDGVTKEAMRLFPPVPLQSRRSLVETELGGLKIPAGTRVLSSSYLINRDPQLYNEPLKFMPERWHNLQRSAAEYPVFGAGSRMCPGSMFGTQMFKIGLASILSTHRLELPPRTTINHRCALTLTPSPTVPIILRDKISHVSSPAVAGSIHELVDLPVVN